MAHIEEQSTGTRVRALQKGLEILKYIMNADREVSIQEIQTAVGFNVSTTYHQLNTLIDAGFVTQNKATKLYGIGLALYLHGMIHYESENYLRRLDPILEACMQLTGETTNLFVCKENEVICVRGVESDQTLKASLKIGRRLPVQETAAGRVFIAFSNTAEGSNHTTKKIDVHPQLTSEKIVSYRANGFITEIDEYDPMITAIAAPVFSDHGDLIFALCTILPSSRATNEAIATIARVMKEGAIRITEVL